MSSEMEEDEETGDTHQENNQVTRLDLFTICPRSSDPYYIVAYYIRWVNATWTFSMKHSVVFPRSRLTHFL